MPDQLRVALIGAAGRVAAPCHLRAWNVVERGRLVAICDLDGPAINALGDEWRIDGRATDYRELLSDPDVDAVDIVTPPYLHHELSVAASEAGKHIYVEKPMARSAEEARRMVDAARATGVTLMVGESYVFMGSHVLARGLIDADEIGDVTQVIQVKGPWLMRHDEQHRLGGQGHFIPWRVDPVLSGGGRFPWLMDHGAHFFATARYLTRDTAIDTVSAMAAGRAPSGELGATGEARQDTVFSVVWRHEREDLVGSWTRVSAPARALDRIGFRTAVIGTRGMIRVFGEGGGAPPGQPRPVPVTLVRNGRVRTFDPRDGDDRVWVSSVNYYDRAHANALQHFTDAALDGTPVRYDGESGLADLSATLAAIKSAIEGRPISLRDLPDGWTAYGG